MEEITLKSFIGIFKVNRARLVEDYSHSPFWKIKANLDFKKEIKRINIIIQAGERFISHCHYQD